MFVYGELTGCALLSSDILSVFASAPMPSERLFISNTREKEKKKTKTETWKYICRVYIKRNISLALLK